MGITSCTDASRGIRRPDEHDAPSPPTAPPRTAVTRELPTESVVEHASAQVSFDAFARGAGVAATATSPLLTAPPAEAPRTPAQQRLDSYRAAYSGPYRVDGREVTASPQFRMAGGFNDARASLVTGKGIDWASPQCREMAAICARAHVSLEALGHCLVGGPSARELRVVTQALIDAGKLPASPGDLASRIKAMQWEHGVGIDCTDYAIGAAMAASGKTRSQIAIQAGKATLPLPACDYFQSADANQHLTRTDVTHARPGDVFCLDDPSGSVGHRAVVYSHKTLDAASVDALAHGHGSIVSRFAAGGPVHAVEVDSSWGAGESGASYGGVRRDTWLYNESTKQWAQLNQRKDTGQPPTFELTPNGPADEKLHALYRFR